MATKVMEIGMTLVAVLMAMLWVGASAQSSCTNALVSMSPCLNYITGNSSTPSSSCCSQLASVVKSQPQCLCQVLSGGGSSLGINVNQTQALALPGACNVQTPSVSKCNGTASPSPTETPSTPSSGTGSKTVPSTDASSDGSISKLSFSLLFFLLFVTSYSSTFASF
ncbi:non-specific lipid transfer protein GPI-anchored 5-like isoform X2 [Telopea speciosissima]|uniref:non-specific lipid transfer protein GPI-anchored 5-like isoform X2 n=1 Tax=Telopea speciosissima TaxID=54955 RepID=UPI001CC68BFC|nr:non-specific lipid transfer protein GPI-anchored 5-like isoform X2 [Telopea speciosissima]